MDEVLNKQIVAMIQGVCITNPELKDVLSVEAIFNFLSMEDSAFGWVEKDRPMPRSIKMLVISTSIKLGATPGMGHVTWLGNAAYCSASFLRNKANADPEWKVKSTRYLPFSEEEKACFLIEPGDMCIKIEQEIEYKGSKFTGVGHGIIGADEIDTAHHKNKAFKFKKNRAMNLKTRAERDLLRRHYPGELPDVSEEEADYLRQKEEEKPIITVPLSTPLIDDGKKEVINAIEETIKNRSLDPLKAGEMLGVDLSVEALEKQSTEDLANISAVLAEYEFDEPKPDEQVSPPEPADGGGFDTQREAQEEIAIVKKILANPPIANDPELKVFVQKFTCKKLRKSDASRIWNAAKPAQNGDYSELESLLAERDNLA